MDTDAKQAGGLEFVVAAERSSGGGLEGETPLGVLERGVCEYADGDAGLLDGNEVYDLGGCVGGDFAVDEMEDGGGVDKQNMVVGKGYVATLGKGKKETTTDDKPGG